MTTRIVAILTLTIMLVHGLLGCCWHHVHAGEEAYAHTSALNAENGEAAERHEHDRQREHHLCHEEFCKYVAPTKARLPQPSTAFVGDLPLSVSSTLSAAGWRIRLSGHAETLPTAELSGLRVHEWTLVWLL